MNTKNITFTIAWKYSPRLNKITNHCQNGHIETLGANRTVIPEEGIISNPIPPLDNVFKTSNRFSIWVKAILLMGSRSNIFIGSIETLNDLIITYKNQK